jgi:hypothetical protein
MVLCISGTSQAEVAYSNDFTGGAGDFTIANGGTGAASAGWAADAACPASAAAGHSAPDNLRWGAFADCNNYGPGGSIVSTASTPSLALPANCTLSFNYLLQLAEGPTFDNADVVVQGGSTLASYAEGTLTSSGSWTALGGLALPSGAVVVDFIGDTPDLTLNTGAGFHVDDVVVDCPTSGTPATSGWGMFVLMMGISMAMAAALFRLRRRSEVGGL